MPLCSTPFGKWVPRGPLVVYVLLALVWLVVVPPWQGPDEPGHYEYARLLAQLHRAPRPRDADPDLQGAIIRALDQHDFWRLTRQPRPRPLPFRFAEIPFFQRSGSQLGNESPWYYLIPALVMSWLPDDPTLHLYVGRVYSILLGLCLLLASGWAVHHRFPHEPHLARGVVWGMALLPMPLFIHTTFNPNVLADLIGAVFFALAWRIVRARGDVPLRHWAALLAVAVIAQTLKRTTLIVLPLAAWLLLGPEQAPLRGRRRAVLGAACALLLAFLLFPAAPNRASAWERDARRTPALRAPAQGVEGSAALLVVDRSPERRGYVAQNLLAADVPRLWGRDVVLTARVRGIEGAPWVCLSLIDRVAQSATCTQVDEEWRTLRVRHRVYAGTPFVRVVVGIGGPRNPRPRGVALVDEVKLMLLGEGQNLLRNGNAETPLSRPQVLIRRVLRIFHLAPSAIYTTPRWDYPLPRKLALAAAVLFTSFWGNFGWLQYPLPVGVYVGLALGTLAIIVGVARRFRRADEETRRLLTFDVMSVSIAVAGSMVPVIGADWLPQGRYLFPVLLPLTALGVQGVEAWRPATWSPARWMRVWVGVIALFSLFAVGWVLMTMRCGIL